MGSCPTCRNLVSRDENASVNIKRSYEAEERPEYLCDTYNRPTKKERGEITLSRRRKKRPGCITGEKGERVQDWKIGFGGVESHPLGEDSTFKKLIQKVR